MIRSDIAKTKTHKYVGKCIYCGSIENLHDEHVIPDSLNGVRLLSKGSCGDCGRITSKFEGSYARDSMLPVRTAWNMRSKRSKKKRPTEFPMRFIKNGQERTVNVPVEDHMSVVPMLEVGPPRRCPAIPHARGFKPGQYESRPFQIRPDEHIEYLLQKYDADSAIVNFHLDPVAFLRMIAKIAYCTAVWRYGLHNIGTAYVVPAILGTSNDIFDWVGSDGKQQIYQDTKSMDTDHVVTTWQSGREILSGVKLFKKSFTPEYFVIVGQLTEQAHGLYWSVGFQ